MSTTPRVRPDPAFGLLELHDQALPHVYNYLLARCGQRQLAEDLTAETFLAAVDAVRKPGARTLSVAWLIGVARHKLADHWRRVERRQRGLRVLEGGRPSRSHPACHRGAAGPGPQCLSPGLHGSGGLR